jgi:hypothetical protein
MSKNKGKGRRNSPTPSLQNIQPINNLEAIDSMITGLSIQKASIIEKGLQSSDLAEIIKASSYLEKQQTKGKAPNVKGHLYLPDDYTFNGKQYKDTLGSLSFEVMQRMGNIPVVFSIVKTRLDQIRNYLKYSHDSNKEGYTIKRKSSLFEDDSKKELSSQDKRKIEYIVNFLEYGGRGGKWDDGDDLNDFVSKIMRDSIVLDQAAFELVRDKKGEMYKHVAIDASLIRQLDSSDPRYLEQFKGMQINGFYPKYAQVWNNQIVKTPNTNESVIYYPWDLGYGIRNRTANVRNNGYGTSELEVGIELVTWILNGMQYNGNFFKNGSNPKGFVNIKNGNMNNSVLNDFRQAWQQMMVGTHNSHKLPIFEGIDLEWIDLQQSNKDMEFQAWTEFLIVIFCSVYSIDPSELGFHFKQQADIFGQQGQKERLQHSQKKGLEPLLNFLEKLINKYIVTEIDDQFEFKFTGLSIDDEDAQIKMDSEKSKNGFVSHEDMFEKYSGRKFDPKKDTILNQIYQSAQQQKMAGGQQMNDIIDEGGDGSENPFDSYEKAAETNPIMKASLDYLNKSFGG